MGDWARLQGLNAWAERYEGYESYEGMCDVPGTAVYDKPSGQIQRRQTQGRRRVESPLLSLNHMCIAEEASHIGVEAIRRMWSCTGAVSNVRACRESCSVLFMTSVPAGHIIGGPAS